jgi:Zn2+/Cd2+-exporting ATPase
MSLLETPSFFPIPGWLTRLKTHPEAIAAIICSVLVLLGWLTLQSGWLELALIILPAAYVVGGYQSAYEGLTTLFTEKALDVDLLMIVAAIGAAGLGLWQREYSFVVDGALLILIFSISGALEGYAMQRTERSIRGLMSLTSDTAVVWQDGKTQEVAIADLQIGNEVIVKPGELVPTDGLIIEGSSALNQASITGESMPVEKTIGDPVFAGTINGHGALRLKIHQPPESSLIQRVIHLVEQAQTETPPSQRFIERFERGYAKAIVIMGVFLVLLPPLLWHWSWETTIYRALIFLVVASPCAVMAAIMPTLLSGIANGAKQGILFKNGAQLELIGRVNAIAFDKTGTLTIGKPQVIQVIPVGSTKTTLLQIAAAVESLSEHPIGNAVVRFAQKAQLEWQPATNVQSYPGQGVTGIVDQSVAIVGKAAFVWAQVGGWSEDLIAAAHALEQTGKTLVWVAHAGKPLGVMAIADMVRPEAAQTIARLKQMGIREIVMLTGDNDRTARSIAHELGITQVYSELLPEDKVNVIRSLQRQYQGVAMVGDGINDAPALAQASVGIAMGTTGSDVALETADIILMADRLERLITAITLGRRSQRIVKQNIVFALSFIGLLLVANFASNITLPLGVIGHEGSTVLVTLSGLRLLRR